MSIPHQKELCVHSDHDKFSDFQYYNDQVPVQ